ncbi:hypothetical protein Tco_0278059 [Tanacetum coccineum]
MLRSDSLRNNHTPSSEVVTKSTSTFPNLFLEETNTFDNSIPESETFCFNLEEILFSGIPLLILIISFRIISFLHLSNDQFPPADRSDFNHEEFADELTHIMPLPELECFKFKIEPDPGDLTSIDLGIRKNVSTTNVNVPLEDDQSSLFAYVVWIFLAFLTYPVVPPYLLSTRNEDTIFDPGISMYHSFMPDVSHRGNFIKFNVYPNRLNESPMMILSPLLPHGPMNSGPIKLCYSVNLKTRRFDFPDCEDSRACSNPQEFHILSFSLGTSQERITKKRRKTKPKRQREPDLRMKRLLKDQSQIEAEKSISEKVTEKSTVSKDQSQPQSTQS